MEASNSIEVINLKKKFKIYSDKGNSLKERLLFKKRNDYEDRWVLKGISFSIKKGEAIGLIGKNGCGKSTTLKLLSRIMYPTEGTINIRGRVSSLLELGAGFHPDMSGRENIYINAAIFGLTKKEIDSRIDEIIAFSEIQEFIDSPVRTYSSGMYMRLAFSIAINVNADILLIDEILAVGDVSFQTKCFERLKEIKRNGTTIVIVSHAMGQIEQICDRCIWIEDGLIKEEGIPKFIDDRYLASMEEKRLAKIAQDLQDISTNIEKEGIIDKEDLSAEIDNGYNVLDADFITEEETSEKPEISTNIGFLPQFCGPSAVRSGNGCVQVTNVSLCDCKGNNKHVFQTGEKMEVRISYKAHDTTLPTNFTIGITRDDGLYCYGSSVLLDSNEVVNIKDVGTAVIRILYNRLLPGKYFLDVGIQAKDYTPYDTICSVMEFYVTAPVINEFGLLSIEHEWEVDGNKIPKSNI